MNLAFGIIGVCIGAIVGWRLLFYTRSTQSSIVSQWKRSGNSIGSKAYDNIFAYLILKILGLLVLGLSILGLCASVSNFVNFHR